MAKKMYMTFNFLKLAWSRNPHFRNTLIRNPRAILPLFWAVYMLRLYQMASLGIGGRSDEYPNPLCSYLHLFK